MDRETFYKALRSRDKRYDGRFYAGVRTTGIYCRPVCPARPLLKNVEFYRSAAEAEGAGYRPCLRCRPDLAPSSPLFQGTGAVVQRALRLIHEGGADSASLSKLSDRLGITDRHLRRLFAEHLGASPVEVATSKRLHLARQLLSQTRLGITEIAYAAGFRSLRRFNDAFRKHYKRAPREYRKEIPEGGTGLRLELPVHEPYDWRAHLRFLARHAIPGLEKVENEMYERVLGPAGVLRVGFVPGKLLITLEGCEVSRLRGELERVRHLFDTDHNPALLPRGANGLRIPGAYDGFETAVNIILGQLISTEAARKLSARFLENGAFLSPAQLKDRDLPFLPRVKAAAIRELARAVHAGEISLLRSAPLEETRARLGAIRGIGPWTVELIALRCLADTDAFPSSDLVVARALQNARVRPNGWRPWRGYLTVRLWNQSKQGKTK
jgi:AraC family transcriptional regulator of adaptative response / DNA-3-methyladenine glycosylase II